jgi:hypothetical protein
MNLANLPLNRTWETTTAGKLAQKEFAFQRMHREPIHIGPPAPHSSSSDLFSTTHKASFATPSSPPLPSSVGARYTLGFQNELGTHVNTKQVSLDELRLGRVHLGDGSRSWSTNFSDAFAKPDLDHPTQGARAPREGKAPRMPFSEVERRFGSLDSTGTMPGKDGVTQGTSEQRAAYADPGRQPPNERILTLGYGNAIGSSTQYQKTPAILAGMTHYSLGEVPRSYVSETMQATAKPTPFAERSKAAAAGQQAPVGPSDVEQGFRQQYNSQHFNIITGGPRLHGALNSDAVLSQRNAAAHERPVGRKQHPCVDPRDRGPSGVRQSFDIITGVARPKERW